LGLVYTTYKNGDDWGMVYDCFYYSIQGMNQLVDREAVPETQSMEDSGEAWGSKAMVFRGYI